MNLEHLEDRLVPSAFVSRGSLIVVGSVYSDTITITQVKNEFQVENKSFFNVSRIEVYASKGNDSIDLSSTSIPSVIYGGDGNDVIHGTQARDFIFGGQGNDSLFGNDGPDYLNGGLNRDYLNGGRGIDWLETDSVFETAISGWNAKNPAVGGTNFHDVQQGYIGTCAFMAAVASATYNHVNLANNIRYLGNFTYRVFLFDPYYSWFSKDVFFNGNIVRIPSGKSADPLVVPEGKFWTVLLQRAYLLYMGYNYMNGRQLVNFAGDYLSPTLTMVTGRTATESLSYDPQVLVQLLQSGAIVTAGTMEVTPDRLIVNMHVYMVKQMYLYRNVWYITLYNPWGIDGVIVQGLDDGLATVPYQVFLRNFDEFGYTM